MRTCVIVAVAVLAFTVPAQSLSLLNIVRWETSQGGNGHWYGIVEDYGTWAETYVAVQELDIAGESGYLATVTSMEENIFIRDALVQYEAQTAILDQLFMGGIEGASGWQWITGEAWGYTNWTSGEPNDLGGTEDRIAMWGPAINPPAGGGQGPLGYWNDTNASTYRYYSIVEWGGGFSLPQDPLAFGVPDDQHVPVPTPEPASYALFACGCAGILLARTKRRRDQ